MKKKQPKIGRKINKIYSTTDVLKELSVFVGLRAVLLYMLIVNPLARLLFGLLFRYNSGFVGLLWHATLVRVLY